jgi:hypothetical protein
VHVPGNVKTNVDGIFVTQHSVVTTQLDNSYSAQLAIYTTISLQQYHPVQASLEELLEFSELLEELELLDSLDSKLELELSEELEELDEELDEELSQQGY